jgi:hypothetical protein
MENLTETKNIIMNPPRNNTWYFVIEPKGDEIVDISFKLNVKGTEDMPTCISSDLRYPYHSGGTELLVEHYAIELKMNSGKIDIYVLDEIGYNLLFNN